MKYGIGLLVLLFVLVPSVSAELVDCGGFGALIESSRDGNDVSLQACMLEAVDSCNTHLNHGLQHMQHLCVEYCGKVSLQYGIICDAYPSHTPSTCAVTKVEWVSPGEYSCHAEGSSQFTCWCAALVEEEK